MNYSVRSASVGAILAARRAGNQQAVTPMVTSSAVMSALAVVLLAGAGLMVRSFLAAQATGRAVGGSAGGVTITPRPGRKLQGFPGPGRRGALIDRRNSGPHAPGMKIRTVWQAWVAFALGVTGLMGAPVGGAANAIVEKRGEIDVMADAILDELYQLKPDAKDRIRQAAGYAVFSNVGVHLLLASFAGGHGVVVERPGRRSYMKMGSAGLGLGLGVKDFRAVFVFHSQARLEAFLRKGWEFGGQLDAAAKSEEKGGVPAVARTASPDLEVYQITKSGLAVQATLQGTRYWRDKNLN